MYNIVEVNRSLLKSSGDLEISVSCFHSKEIQINSPLVIFAHGFKGFKDWGGFPFMMERFAEAGFVAVSFDFSHNGTSHQTPQDFTRLDLFSENTHSKELEDLGTVIDHFYTNADKYNIDKNRIALIGHSRGGAAVILKAASDRRIKALVTLASVADVNRYTEKQRELWRKNGYIDIPNARTNQLMRMNVSFLDDIESYTEKLDIKKAVSKLNIPWLIIHGKEDLAVKVSDAEALYSSADNQRTELVIIGGTGHTFGVEHPFKGTTKAFDKVIKNSVSFLNEHLK
jgi:hypothetical protein